jgi:hypothetical protein
MPRFQPEEIFRALERHGVRYVLIGGLAATLHGSNLRTGDVDICPAADPDNLVRLAEALREMEARVRAPGATEGLRFACDAEILARTELANLTTRFGDFDLSFRPSGTDGYEDLRQGASDLDLDGLSVPTASLDDVIRSKEAAGRAKDQAHLPVLRLLRDEARRLADRGPEQG